MIPQIQPWIDHEEAHLLNLVVTSTQITEGPYTEKFENLTKELTGSKYAIAYANGTTALYSVLTNLNIGPGDEVIVPGLTFIATATSVIQVGATPVFCDVEAETYCMDPEMIERLITEKTRAIIPVHLYGNAADMDSILDIAKKYSLLVIEDAAQGVGVTYKGNHVGTMGDAGILSYYGNKTITCGEGGMILTNSQSFRDKVYSFKTHGRNQKGIFLHEEIGFNFSFTEMQAAIGVAQMNKLDKIIVHKNRIFNAYKKEMPEYRFYSKSKNTTSFVPWFSSIIVSDPVELQKYLLEKEIGTRRFFPSLDLQPCFSGIASRFPLKNSHDAYSFGLSLPSSVSLSKDEIKYIANSIKEFYV